MNWLRIFDPLIPRAEEDTYEGFRYGPLPSPPCTDCGRYVKDGEAHGEGCETLLESRIARLEREAASNRFWGNFLGPVILGIVIGAILFGW